MLAPDKSSESSSICEIPSFFALVASFFLLSLESFLNSKHIAGNLTARFLYNLGQDNWELQPDFQNKRLFLYLYIGLKYDKSPVRYLTNLTTW